MSFKFCKPSIIQLPFIFYIPYQQLLTVSTGRKDFCRRIKFSCHYRTITVFVSAIIQFTNIHKYILRKYIKQFQTNYCCSKESECCQPQITPISDTVLTYNTHTPWTFAFINYSWSMENNLLILQYQVFILRWLCISKS